MKPYKITVLGSCRQDSLYSNPKYTMTNIRNFITYPHYTKEAIQLINYCLRNHLTPQETKYTFRSGILANTCLQWRPKIREEFLSSDIYILEIASRKCYTYAGRYVHHILYDSAEYNSAYKDKIHVRELTNEEIEEDILTLRELLGNKPFIIVGHITTKDNKASKRNELLELLDSICQKHGIPFIHPTNELSKRDYNIQLLVRHDERIVTHYNDIGHRAILSVYDEFIHQTMTAAAAASTEGATTST
jgi:hypothetical protein